MDPQCAVISNRMAGPTGETGEAVGPGRQEGRSRGEGERPVPTTASSWWLLDLGPDIRLLPNYYTLRHDGSLDYLRSWSLQVCGSERRHSLTRLQY